MAVIGPEGDAVLDGTGLIDIHQGFDNTDHIDIAIEMIGFKKGSVRLAQSGAQMHEMDALGKLFDHGHEIIVSPHTQGARAKTHAIGRAFHGIENGLIIGGGGGNARQAEQRTRGIIGMQGQGHPKAFGHRCHRLQKFNQMLAQARCINMVIGFQTGAEGRNGQRVGG